MKSITLLLLLCGGVAWAEREMKPCEMRGDCVGIKPMLYYPLDVQIREARTLPYGLNVLEFSTPTVIIGSMTWTLSDFVAQGKFCEWRGKHEWMDTGDPCVTFAVWPPRNCPQMKCEICKRFREKIKVNREVEEWEP